MKYRSRSEIAGEILTAASGGATKTMVMYKAFLSYAQLKEYLSVLLFNKLLTYDDETRTYKTTDKGHLFLELHRKLSNSLIIR